MITIKVGPKTTFADLKDLGLELLGKDRLTHFRYIIGNYWEERKTGLNTENLFKEMLRLFKKKKIVKKLMDDGREEAIKHLINQDIDHILNVWCRKVYRILARGDDGVLWDQSITCERASIAIEEDSECQVIFEGKTYTCLVEGRRAIVGLIQNDYENTKVDSKTNIRSDFFTRRKLKVYNNFVGKTFWRTIGRITSVTVDLEDKGSVDKKDLFGQDTTIRRRRRKKTG